MYNNSNIIYNTTCQQHPPARNQNTQHHPPAPNTTQIKLHHSRHPSDNLCGVKLKHNILQTYTPQPSTPIERAGSDMELFVG